MRRCGRILVLCVAFAAPVQVGMVPAEAQSRWSTEDNWSNQSTSTPRPAPAAPNSGSVEWSRPNNYPGNYPPIGAYPGQLGGQGGYGHQHGHHGQHGQHGQHFDDVNLGLILTPDWVGGWNSAPNSASGGYYAPGGEAFGQPVLNQPPFYSGQPAPNFYQAPRAGLGTAEGRGQSQYIPPRSGSGSGGANPALANDGAEPELAATGSGRKIDHAESTSKRRSILVRPESDPTLSQTLATGTPAESDYETSRAAFAAGEYHAALGAATAAAAADPANGKLQLYLAHCHFAVGEFEQSARALNSAFAQLPPEQWGLVIENFRQFYKRNDYVKQFDELLSFSQQAGQKELGAALQAYHYRYLGHPDAAAEQLQIALQSAAPPQLAKELKSLLQSSANRRTPPLPTPIAGN